MNHLRRELAPISDRAWKLIEEEARQALKTYLAARKVVDFDGPHGWDRSSVNLGRTRPLSINESDEPQLVREVLPLIELSVPFQLKQSELDAVDRGAQDIDLDEVRAAARRLATLEDHVAFYGVADANVQGMLTGSAHAAVAVSSDFRDFPAWVSSAEAKLRDAGVGGPYAIVLDPAAFTLLAETTGPGGYPVLQHVRRLLDGPTIWAPALEGALVASIRGGDFQLVVGQDISVGYRSHDEQRVSLYLEESLTFRLFAPEACVPLSIGR